MSYSIGSSSDSCYEGTTCLINKLGIRDGNLLAETESAYTLAKASYLELNPLSGEFDFEHYKNIHRFLFCDLYDWAGELRRTDLSKKGTVFVAADSIQECAEACFASFDGTVFGTPHACADNGHTANFLKRPLWAAFAVWGLIRLRNVL